MKTIDTFEYVSALKGLVEEGHEVSMIISGSSMAPFLCHERDSIFFKAPDCELKLGDIVFYQRASGQYVVHRICKVKNGAYYIVGDAQTSIEGPVERAQIFAVVTKVVRNGVTLKPGDYWWDFFAHVWIRIIPFRPLTVKLYSLIKRT